MRILILLMLMAGRAWGSTYYVTVAGLGGEPDYEQRFTAEARDLDKVFRSQAGGHVVTLSGGQATAAGLRGAMAGVAREARAEDDLVVVLIGHGSFDGVEYKMNLVGPDVSAGELAGMMDRVAARRQMVVAATSASGGAVAALERQGRAVVAATKSGTEKNAVVFGRYWVEALQDAAADTDKSESVSALEAFVYAARKTAGFYDSQKRVATEHAVFDDIGRGDPVREAGGGQGGLMASLTVLRMASGAGAANDPARRGLLAKKEELEQKIDVLKYGKAAMDPGEYKRELTAALLELARTQGELDK